MKIKIFTLFLIAVMSIVGCATNNKSNKLAQVEYAQPIHVSKNVKSRRVYTQNTNSTKAGVIKPYVATTTTTTTTTKTANSSRVVSYADLSKDRYTVAQGDTLYSIAFRYGKDYREVARINDIDSPYNIVVGQVIELNDAAIKSPVSVSGKSSVYIVQKGDTAVSVARKNGLTFYQLVQANNLKKPYTLVVGQRLNTNVANAVYSNKTAPKVVPVANTASDVAQVTPNQTTTVAPSINTSAPVKVVTGKTASVSGISWMWPTKGTVIRNFSSSNKGLDISGSRGQNVNAAAAGQIVYSGNALRGYGNLIIINHNNEYLSAYAHNDMLLVKEGQMVKRGQVIAKMGSTDATQVKLHFEIRHKGNSVNPRNYLPK